MSSVSLRGHFAGSLPHSWIQLVGGLPSIAPTVPHLLRLLRLRSSYDMFISSHLHVSHAVHVPLVTTDVERTHTAAGQGPRDSVHMHTAPAGAHRLDKYVELIKLSI